MLENKLHKEIKFSVAAILVADRELDRLAPPAFNQIHEMGGFQNTKFQNTKSS